MQAEFPGWNQNSARMEPEFSQNGTRIQPEWSQNYARMEPEFCQNGARILPEFAARMEPEFASCTGFRCQWNLNVSLTTLSSETSGAQ
jgi:hypothetical protein